MLNVPEFGVLFLFYEESDFFRIKLVLLSLAASCTDWNTSCVKKSSAGFALN